MALVERLITAQSSAGTSGPLESRVSLEHSEAAPENARDVTPKPEPSAERAGLGQRLKHSVWLPVVRRALGTLGVLSALSIIGAVAARRGPSTHPVALSERPPPSAEAAAIWIASQGEPAEPASKREAPATAGAAPAPTASDAPNAASAPSAPSGLLPDGRVILNLASASDLRKLPGVGQKRAEAIVALRAKLGGKFRRIGDLLRVRGIGPKRLKQWQEKLVLDAPKAPAPPSAAVK